MDDQARVALLRGSALQAAQMGAPALSTELAERACRLRPDDPSLLEILAMAAFSAKRYDAAISAASRAIAAGGSSPIRSYLSAESSRRNGDPSTAAERAREGLARFPGDVPLTTCVAESLLELGLAREAATFLDAVLVRVPDAWELVHLRLRAARDLGDADRLEWARRSFNLRRGDSAVAIRFAEELLEHGERSEARAVLIDAIARRPSDRAARHALIHMTRPPRWFTIATVVFPFALAIIVALLVDLPADGGGPQPGVIALLLGFVVSAVARRAWVRREAGPDHRAVRAARAGLTPAMAREAGRRWKLILLAGLTAILWASVMAILYSSTLGWRALFVWVGVFVVVMAPLLLAGWLAGWIKRRRPEVNPFSLLPIEQGTCRCEELVVLEGSRARSYLADHLGGATTPVSEGIERARCTSTGSTWVVLTIEVDDIAELPMLLRMIQPVEPERVGVYL